jgi:hypothetical protein
MALQTSMDITAKRPAIRKEQKPRGWYAVFRSPLLLCLLAGALIRIWLSIRTHGTLDGDEALLGIQAEHILQGERPIYFYGLSYFGSLEAYVVAAVSAVFGPSVAVLRAVTTAFGLVLIALTWWFAGLLADAARLPLYAKKRFTITAALVAAIPPVYDGIIELRTGGGWIESFTIMVLLLILAFRLTTRWHEGASTGELALRWAGIGFVVGLGMWIYPLVTVAILAAALWIVGDSLIAAIKRIRASLPIMRAIWPSLKELLLAVVAIPACALGFTPGIIWGASHQWANITYLFSLGGGWTLQRVITISRVSARYGACVAPRVIGGATPSESLPLTIIHSPLLLLGVGSIAFSVFAIIGSYRWPNQALARARRLVALPALFGACSAVLFCTSSASTSILLGCRNDLGGRYASPLALALPFFLATAFTVISMYITEKASVRQASSVASALAALRAAGTPDQRKYAMSLLGVFALLVAYFAGQASTYGLTNPDEAFQSAYCTIAPANYGPIIAYLEQQHVQYVWATNLLAYPISFETNSRIIVADPLALSHPKLAINRIPSYSDAVARADRPTLLVFVKHGDPHPYLLQLLDEQHVTYKTAFFPSQPGVDVMAVTPLNQNVSPLTSPNLEIFYCKVINSKSDIPS